MWSRERYRDRRRLNETTRALEPEEMAELQVEQGYLGRALSIYEELLEREPANVLYQRRCTWLRRLNVASQRPAPRDPRGETLRGFPAPWL